MIKGCTVPESPKKRRTPNDDPQSPRYTEAKEVASAVKRKEDEFLIEGDLRKSVFRIKATGRVAWAVCAVSLAAAIAFYIATPGLTVAATPVGGAAAGVAGLTMSVTAAATLGPAVGSAIAIGVCAGGVGALNTLRDQYDIVEKTDQYIRLRRKGKRKEK